MENTMRASEYVDTPLGNLLKCMEHTLLKCNGFDLEKRSNIKASGE